MAKTSALKHQSARIKLALLIVVLSLIVAVLLTFLLPPISPIVLFLGLSALGVLILQKLDSLTRFVAKLSERNISTTDDLLTSRANQADQKTAGMNRNLQALSEKIMDFNTSIVNFNRVAEQDSTPNNAPSQAPATSSPSDRRNLEELAFLIDALSYSAPHDGTALSGTQLASLKRFLDFVNPTEFHVIEISITKGFSYPFKQHESIDEFVTHTAQRGYQTRVILLSVTALENGKLADTFIASNSDTAFVVPNAPGVTLSIPPGYQQVYPLHISHGLTYLYPSPAVSKEV